jgi:WD40 repeat protein
LFDVEPAVDPSPPHRQLTLQFINGFHVEDSRKNIFWGTKPNSIIYCAAGVGVNMDCTTLKQKFMGAGDIKSAKGHTDDIMALGVSPDRKLVITGSLGAQPEIIIWGSDSMEIKGRTKLGRNTRAISTIRFSKNGKLFFCSDKHNDSNVYCFDIETMKPKGSEKCGSDPVIDAETGSDNRFACATKSGVWFFKFIEGQGMTKSRGIFGNHPLSAMSSITYSNDDNCFLSGSIDGFIYYWDEMTCTKVKKTHDGSIMALSWVDGIIYSSGSQDKSLKLTDYAGNLLKTYQLPSYAKSIDAINKKIVVGTKCGRMIIIDGDTQKETMHGHWTGETWGLAFGADGLVYTTGDDNSILAFNPKTTTVEKEGIINQTPGKKFKIGGASTLSLLPPNQQSRGIALNKLGHLALGLNDGTLSIRTTAV